MVINFSQSSPSFPKLLALHSYLSLALFLSLPLRLVDGLLVTYFLSLAILQGLQKRAVNMELRTGPRILSWP